jgi:hypothetical protein
MAPTAGTQLVEKHLLLSSGTPINFSKIIIIKYQVHA